MDEEISLGDFVLTGGEIAALAVTDAVCRLVPGVLSDPQCYIGESHWDGLLEYPQYTRPEVWEGRAVPEVLLGGDHEKVERWRRLKQLERTRDKRPDLFQVFTPVSETDQELLKNLERAEHTFRLSKPVTWRLAKEEDLPEILHIREDARQSLKKLRVDQWQGNDPDEEQFRTEIGLGECFVLLHGNEIGGFFSLSTRPEPCYDDIRDGKWTENQTSAVLRHAAVSEKYRGSGLAEALIRAAENESRARGLRCVRTDTHRKNKPMQRLLRDTGFRYRGNVDVKTEPGHDPRRQCFEKLLKEKKA